MFPDIIYRRRSPIYDFNAQVTSSLGVARRYRWVFRKDRLEATKKGATAASKSLANVGWHQAWPEDSKKNATAACTSLPSVGWRQAWFEATKKGATVASKSLPNVGWHQALALRGPSGLGKLRPRGQTAPRPRPRGVNSTQWNI